MRASLISSARDVASAVVLAALCTVVPATRAAAAESYETMAVAFKTAAAADKPAVRLAAYEKVATTKDPRAVDLVLSAVAQEVARRDALLKLQSKTGTELEKALAEIERTNALKVPPTPRETDAFNKRTKKLEAQRDAANDRLREVAGDLTQERAILAAGMRALAAIVEALPEGEAAPALGKVEAAWRGPKSLPDDQLRWIDFLTRAKRPGVAERLSALARDDAADPRLRAAAISARVTRGDAGAIDDALASLSSTSFPVQAAAVEALRTLHRKEGIAPLIDLLGRPDLGEIRARAHLALRSLTGEKHGPYEQPWKEWWAAARATFVLPEKAAAVAELAQPEKGLTFYGITTFSERILFVLDVSGSMTDYAHPGASGTRGAERKIDVLRKELAGAIDMLEDKKRFNVLLFNHRVIPYLAGALPGDAAARDAAKKWALAVEPSSGTNLHDSLEAAFQLAGVTADGKPFQTVFDTIFFMTDGTPTAGKLQKAEEILAAVEQWNRVALLSVHCIGVGQGADEKFLAALAAANHGQFVKR